MSAISALIALLAGLAANDPSPSSAPALLPVGPWTLDDDPGSGCLITRDFGRADDPVTVGFQYWPTQSSMEILIRSKGRDDGVHDGTGTIAVSPGDVKGTGYYMRFALQKSGRELTRMTVDRATFDALSDAGTLTINTDGSTKIVTKGATTARAAVAKCQANLLVSWGADLVAYGNGATPPVPLHGPAAWFSSDDYPTAAFRAGVGGRVVLLLRIDEKGGVSECRVVSTENPLLNDQSCVSAKGHGRYRPAKDATGKVIVSWALIPVHWSMR